MIYRSIKDDHPSSVFVYNSPDGWVIPGLALYYTMQFVSESEARSDLCQAYISSDRVGPNPVGSLFNPKAGSNQEVLMKDLFGFFTRNFTVEQKFLSNDRFLLESKRMNKNLSSCILYFYCFIYNFCYFLTILFSFDKSIRNNIHVKIDTS